MSQSNVIPKESLTAWERWEMDSLSGGRSVRGVQLPTAQQLEDMQRDAQREGFEAGYRDGAARAQAEAARLAGLVAALDRDLTTLDESLAENLLSLSVSVARRVLMSALDARPELLLPVLREAIAEISAQGSHRRIVLHPDDARLVREHAPDLLQGGAWQLVEDPALTRGGGRVRTGLGEIDATLETRWQRVLASIGRDDAWLPPAASGAGHDNG